MNLVNSLNTGFHAYAISSNCHFICFLAHYDWAKFYGESNNLNIAHKSSSSSGLFDNIVQLCRQYVAQKCNKTILTNLTRIHSIKSDYQNQHPTLHIVYRVTSGRLFLPPTWYPHSWNHVASMHKPFPWSLYPWQSNSFQIPHKHSPVKGKNNNNNKALIFLYTYLLSLNHYTVLIFPWNYSLLG